MALKNKTNKETFQAKSVCKCKKCRKNFPNLNPAQCLIFPNLAMPRQGKKQNKKNNKSDVIMVEFVDCS